MSTADIYVFRFLDAVPTAELEPFSDTYVQSDEVCPPLLDCLPLSADKFPFLPQIDMGMTYDELSIFGRMRKVEKCGPFAMYTKLLQEWGNRLPPEEVSAITEALLCLSLSKLRLQIARKVKHFFFEYARNRHKM
jgi:NAD+ synthase (glutamine-hydrolysing)